MSVPRAFVGTVPTFEALMQGCQKVFGETHAPCQHDCCFTMLAPDLGHFRQGRQHARQRRQARESATTQRAPEDQRQHLGQPPKVDLAGLLHELELIAHDAGDDVGARRATRVAQQGEIECVTLRRLVDAGELSEPNRYRGSP